MWQIAKEEQLIEELEADAEEHPFEDGTDVEEPERKKLKRELRAEALARLEDSARTQREFENVIAWWDRLDANRERRERYHELSRSGDDVPLDYGASADEYLEWICGYANAQGGKIYIGCDDDGNVIGLANAHKLLEDIPNKIRDAMGIIVGVNLYEQNGKEYIEVDVPSYPIGISCKGVYYYRSGSTRQILTGPALEAFLMRKRGATWDNLPLPAFSLNDIDDAIIDRFKKWASKKGRIDRSVLDEPKDILMEKLHLMNGSYLTNAAMLLFSKDPEKWQLGAYVKIGFFETDADLLYQDEIHGSILEQIDKIVELVYLKYMKAKITYEGMQRIERYFVPEAALREALLNALCHKQYQSGVPIQISVYEDRMYIANCGCLPENWTLENLMRKHASSPYNPNIAHVFYLAGFIES